MNVGISLFNVGIVKRSKVQMMVQEFIKEAIIKSITVGITLGSKVMRLLLGPGQRG